MAQDIYYHKQQPNGFAESPDTNLSLTQSSKLDGAVTMKGIVGITAVASKVLPAAKQLGGAIVNATGNSRLKKKIALIESGIGFGTMAYAIGLPVAVGVTLGSAVVTEIGMRIEERNDQLEQRYQQKLLGSKLNNLNSGGAYID